MNPRQLVRNFAAVTPLRDERYATLWETCGPDTGVPSLSAAFVSIDPGKTSPLHWHDKTEEIYMIARGHGVMYLGEHAVNVSVGDCVSIPIGTIHAIGNPGIEPLEMWVVTSPPYCVDDDCEVDEK